MLYPQKNIKRTIENLDGIWNTEINGEKRDMAVPGSWNEQYNSLFNYFGKCKYTKKLFISSPKKNQDIWLRFGSVTTNAFVSINSVPIGEHFGTALPFEFNITDKIIPDSENTIEVIVDNTLDPWGLPPAKLLNNEGRAGFTDSYPAVTYDFFPYGGIHRSVYLYTCSKKRIENIKINSDLDGHIHFYAEFSDKVIGTLKVRTDEKTVSLDISNNYADGKIIVERPRIWDINKPELYEMTFELYEDDELIDAYTESYGIRKIEIKNNKLFLNNKEIFLKGFGKHEDFSVLGKGYNSALTVKDFSLMSSLGANSFRTSHYPYDEQIMYYADRHGILIIDETPFVGLNERMYNEDILLKAKKVIRELIQRDFNHPSVIMWSMANEPFVTSEKGADFFKEMYNEAKKSDITRPVTYVAHAEPEHNLGMKYYDIICLNKYYGWYINPGLIDDTLSDLSDCLDRFHQAFQKGIIITEFGADAISGMHSDPPQMFSEEFQCEIIEKQYKLMREKSYISGTHVWAFADFKTAQTVSRILLNRKGVFTRDRQPKAAAHMLKKLWGTNIERSEK